MNRRLFLAESATDLERCYAVLRELRPHLSYEQFLEIYEQAHAGGDYTLAAIEDQGQIVAVMGYRFYSDFVRGRHLYIDDLVSRASARSRGLGAELLAYAERLAKDDGCNTLRLCAALENERGIRFYEREGWTRRSYAFVKKV